MSSSHAAKFKRAARLFKALSHELRLAIVCGLRTQPCTQTFMAETLGIPQPTVAQHLKVLRSEGLIKAERRGVEVVFSLADPEIVRVIEMLCGDNRPAMPSSWQEIAAGRSERRAGL